MNNVNHKRALGVILQTGGLGSQSSFRGVTLKGPLEKLYTVLILCEKKYEEEKMSVDQTQVGMHAEVKGDQHPNDMFFLNGLFLPKGQCGQIVEEIIAADICDILNKVLKLDSEKVLENHKKRLIPRFRFFFLFSSKVSTLKIKIVLYF